MDTDLLSDLQTIIQSWQAIARREQEKVAMTGRIDDLREYRAGYAHGMENAADELVETLAQALQDRNGPGSP